MLRLLDKLFALLVTVSIFGLAFALGALGVDWLSWELTLELMPGASPRGLERFIAGFFAFAFGAVAGIAVGVLYALIPRDANDPWIGMALGAGVASAFLLLLPYAFFWEFAAIALAAVIAALCAWFIRWAGIWP